MGKNAILGVLIALIVVVLLVGVGAIVWLNYPTDSFNGTPVLESTQEQTLKTTIESLQADQARLKQELEVAKKQAQQTTAPVNTSKTTQPQTDNLGLLSDLSNCDSVVSSFKSDENGLRTDVEDALQQYEQDVQDLIILEKDMVVLKAKIANETDSNKRDSLRDQEKDLNTDINDAEDTATSSKNDFEDYLSQIQDVRSKWVDTSIKCLDTSKADLSKATCNAAIRDADNQEQDAKNEVDDVKDDKNAASDDTQAQQAKIDSATTLKNNATTQVQKDQFDQEIKWVGKVKKLFKDWENEFNDFENDLQKVDREAKTVKNDVETECRKY